MGWTLPPDGIAMCQRGDVEIATWEGVSMEEISIVRADLAKNVFQIDAANAEG